RSRPIQEVASALTDTDRPIRLGSARRRRAQRRSELVWSPRKAQNKKRSGGTVQPAPVDDAATVEAGGTTAGTDDPHAHLVGQRSARVVDKTRKVSRETTTTGGSPIADETYADTPIAMAAARASQVLTPGGAGQLPRPA